MALTKIGTLGIADDAITAAKLPADSVGASELANNAVDTAAIAADAVDGTKIADDSIDSEHYAAGSIDNAHLADNAVDGTHIALGSDAQGDVMYYNGTDYVRLAPGTSGQFLKTLGASANPAWGTVVTDTSGAWTSGTATTGKALVMGF